MTAALHPATGARIQQEIDCRNYRKAAEFVAHPVSLITTANDFLLPTRKPS